MAVPLTPATKLDAVNRMLASIGQTPVNSLDVSGIRDVAIAELAIDNTTQEVLEHGWSWNTDYEYMLPLDLNGNILIPSNALYVEPSDRQLDYVPRYDNGVHKMYNRKDKTFTFTQGLEVDITWAQPFNELPSPARTYIATRAARIFQSQVIGSQILFQFTELHEREALAKLQKLENRQKNLNILESDVEANLIWNRTRNPYRW